MIATEAAVKDWKPAIRHLCKVEPRFAPLVKQHGLPTMAPARDLYGSLGRAIVYQQLSGKAAATILGRVQAALGSPKTFPKASVLVRAEMPVLRGAGLSQAKALALLDLAARVKTAGSICARRGGCRTRGSSRRSPPCAALARGRPTCSRCLRSRVRMSSPMATWALKKACRSF